MGKVNRWIIFKYKFLSRCYCCCCYIFIGMLKSDPFFVLFLIPKSIIFGEKISVQGRKKIERREAHLLSLTCCQKEKKNDHVFSFFNNCFHWLNIV